MVLPQVFFFELYRTLLLNEKGYPTKRRSALPMNGLRASIDAIGGSYVYILRTVSPYQTGGYFLCKDYVGLTLYNEYRSFF